jgi:addiction module RelB/DinJ family antitoxin
MATKTINISVEESTKEKAQAIFESLGMSFSTGIAVYLEQVVLKRGIPFSLKAAAKTPGSKTPSKAKGHPSAHPKTGVSSEASLNAILESLKDKPAPDGKK